MIDVVMPKWGVTMEGGVIVHFHKELGDIVAEGDRICEVETDKVNEDLVALSDGVIGEWVAAVGDEVACGGVIGRIYTADEWAGRG